MEATAMFKVSIDTSQAIAGIADFQSNMLPYATAIALTKTAQVGRDAVVRSLGQRFILRNSYTERGVLAKPATKSNLESAVVFDREYMVIQETGGTRTSHRGVGHYLAVPMARELKSRSVIPLNLRPKFLLRNADLGQILKHAAVKTKSRRQKFFQGFQQTFGKGFIIQVNNKLFIVTRIASKGPRQLKFWYYLAPAIRISDPRLHMQETVAQSVAENFAKNFDAGLKSAAAGFARNAGRY